MPDHARATKLTAFKTRLPLLSEDDDSVDHSPLVEEARSRSSDHGSAAGSFGSVADRGRGEGGAASLLDARSPQSVARSSGSVAKSTGSAAARSSGSVARSTGSAAKSSGSVARSSGSAERSTGSVARSFGSAERSTGSVARSSGSAADRGNGEGGAASLLDARSPGSAADLGRGEDGAASLLDARLIGYAGDRKEGRSPRFVTDAPARSSDARLVGSAGDRKEGGSPGFVPETPARLTDVRASSSAAGRSRNEGGAAIKARLSGSTTGRGRGERKAASLSVSDTRFSGAMADRGRGAGGAESLFDTRFTGSAKDRGRREDERDLASVSDARLSGSTAVRGRSKSRAAEFSASRFAGSAADRGGHRGRREIGSASSSDATSSGLDRLEDGSSSLSDARLLGSAVDHDRSEGGPMSSAPSSDVRFTRVVRTPSSSSGFMTSDARFTKEDRRREEGEDFPKSLLGTRLSLDPFQRSPSFDARLSLQKLPVAPRILVNPKSSFDPRLYPRTLSDTDMRSSSDAKFNVPHANKSKDSFLIKKAKDLSKLETKGSKSSRAVEKVKKQTNSAPLDATTVASNSAPLDAATVAVLVRHVERLSLIEARGIISAPSKPAEEAGKTKKMLLTELIGGTALPSVKDVPTLTALLRTKMATGEITANEMKSKFNQLVETLTTLAKRKPTAIERKSSEWWSEHGTAAVAICDLLTASPDGLGTMCVAFADAVHEDIYKYGDSITLPGTFALRVVANFLFPQPLAGENSAPSSWLLETGLMGGNSFPESSETKASVSELEAWCEVLSWTSRVCGTKTKTALTTLPKVFPVLEHVFGCFTNAFCNEEVACHRTGALIESRQFTACLIAVRSCLDLSSIMQVLKSIRNRHVLYGNRDFVNAFHSALWGLAEIGVQLIVDLIVRDGTVLMTNSLSLAEGDAFEHMLSQDLNWLLEDSGNTASRENLFKDGRLALMLCSSIYFPGYCPNLSQKCLRVMKKLAVGGGGTLVNQNWERVAKILKERRSTCVRREPKVGVHDELSIAIKAFSNMKRAKDKNSIPSFAKRDVMANNSIDAFLQLRTRRFSDAVLGFLEIDDDDDDDNNNDNKNDDDDKNDENDDDEDDVVWRTDCMGLYAEAVLEGVEENNEKEAFEKGVTCGDRDLDWLMGGSLKKSDAPLIDWESYDSWLAFWGARALALCLLKSKYGSAKDTFEKFENALQKLQQKDASERLLPGSRGRFMMMFLWNLHRELLVFAATHSKVPKVSTFFIKNRDTCESWLLRLTGLATEVDLGLGSSSMRSPRLISHHDATFYFNYYDIRSWDATRPIVERLALLGETDSIRALSCRADTFCTSSSKFWMQAMEAFSAGAYLRALGILKMDESDFTSEEDEKDWGKLSKSTSEFASKCKFRLSNWPVRDVAPHSNSSEVQGETDVVFRLFSIDQAKSTERSSFLVNSLNSPEAHVFAAVAQWRVSPQMNDKVENLKKAIADAKSHGWSRAGVFLELVRGPEENAESREADETNETDDLQDEVRAVLSVASRTIDANGLSKQILRVLSTELSDPHTANWFLSAMEKTAPDSSVARVELYEAFRKFSSIAEAKLEFLAPQGSFERQVAMLELSPPMATSMSMFALPPPPPKVDPKLCARWYYALARRASSVWSPLDQEHAAVFFLKCMEFDVEGKFAESAFVSFLRAANETLPTSESITKSAVLQLSNRVLILGLPHLLARASSTLYRRNDLIQVILEKLAVECPLEAVWGLIAEESSQAVDTAMKRLPNQILSDAQRLKTGLVHASRTWDEDWDDLFEDVGKRLWIGRLHAKGLWDETLGLVNAHGDDGSEGISAYHKKFQASPAAQAIEAWVLEPGHRLKLAKAKETLGEWFAMVGNRRTGSELSLQLRGDFSVVPLAAGGAAAKYRTMDRIDVLRTKTRPRRVGFECGDGRAGELHFLLKSAEDLRLDQRLVRLWNLIAGPKHVRSYLVVPLSRRVGLIQWVEHTVPLFHAYREWAATSFAQDKNDSADATFEVNKGEKIEVTEQYRQALLKTGVEDKLGAFRELKSTIDKKLLGRFLVNSCETPTVWWSRANQFTKSCGATNALGWIVGLGDRHLDNMLLDMGTGDVVHVDLNVCFDKGSSLRVPETVPFRLSGIMVEAMPFADNLKALERGAFGTAFQSVLGKARMDRHAILSFLDSFVHDPIRPQKTKLQMSKFEFEHMRETFVHDAASWLTSPMVVEMEKTGNMRDAPRNANADDVLKKSMDVAKKKTERVLKECSKRLERSSEAFEVVLESSERALMLNDDLDSFPGVDFPDEAVRSIASLMVNSEILCTRISSGALGNVANALLAREKFSGLELPCQWWSLQLQLALDGEDEAVEIVRNTSKTFASEADFKAISDFKTMVQSILDDHLSDDLVSRVLKKDRQFGERWLQSRRRIFDVLALAEAVLLIVKESKDTIYDRKASEAISMLQASHMELSPSVSRKESIGRLPRRKFRDFFDACSSMLEKSVVDKMNEYFELIASKESVLTDFPRVCRVLRFCIQAATEAVFVSGGEDDEEAAAGGSESKAERSARSANARVAARLNDGSPELVANLIERATDERNLSEMFIGWMAWL